MPIKPRTNKLPRKPLDLPNKRHRIRRHRNNPRPSMVQSFTVHHSPGVITGKYLREITQCILCNFLIVLAIIDTQLASDRLLAKRGIRP